LPAGAATAAKQDNIITAIGNIPAAPSTVTANLGTLNGAATAAKQDDIITAIGNIPAAPSTVTANLGTLNGAATAAKQDDIITAIGNIPVAPTEIESEVGSRTAEMLSDLKEVFPQCEDLKVPMFCDANLRKVFGANSLLNEEGRVVVEPKVLDREFKFAMPSVAAAVRVIPVAGFNTLIIELTGTWAGTIQFEASVSGTSWVSLFGVNISSQINIAGSTTALGIYRFNIAGLRFVQLRLSAYTSGAPIVNGRLSASLGAVNVSDDLYGSQVNYLSQKATTYELNTYDTNLATVFGATSVMQTAAQPAPVARVAPAIATATAFASPALAYQPQYWQRARVEAAGSERLPFAQEANTNNVLISSPALYSLLEDIRNQLLFLNMQTAGMSLPEDFKPYQ
jgi:hypothetical protein